MGAIQYENRDFGKMFLDGMRTRTGTYTNGSGATVTLAMGTLMGRATTSGKWKPWADDATDGSEVPRGVLLTDYSVAAGADQDIAIVHAGVVVGSRIVLPEGKTLQSIVTQSWDNEDSPPVATTVTLGRVEDVLMAMTGITLVGTTELSGYDNVV